MKKLLKLAVKWRRWRGLRRLYNGLLDQGLPVHVRNREIYRRYLLGAKVAQLSKQYGVSERSILRIVKDVRPGQISLFDQDDT